MELTYEELQQKVEKLEKELVETKSTKLQESIEAFRKEVATSQVNIDIHSVCDKLISLIDNNEGKDLIETSYTKLRETWDDVVKKKRDLDNSINSFEKIIEIIKSQV